MDKSSNFFGNIALPYLVFAMISLCSWNAWALELSPDQVVVSGHLGQQTALCHLSDGIPSISTLISIDAQTGELSVRALSIKKLKKQLKKQVGSTASRGIKVRSNRSGKLLTLKSRIKQYRELKKQCERTIAEWRTSPTPSPSESPIPDLNPTPTPGLSPDESPTPTDPTTTSPSPTLTPTPSPTPEVPVVNTTIQPALTVSRASCVAPCLILADATATSTSNVNITRPLHELDYSYDFGDTASGVWGTNGRLRNQAKGPIASHLYKVPGSYIINLKVTMGRSGFNTTSQQVEILNPDQIFAGSNTICISRVGDFNGCPLGASHVTTSNWGSGSTIQSLISSGKRILLHRGETAWNASSPISINIPGPGQVGAYGSCSSLGATGLCSNNPKVVSTASDIFSLSGQQPAFDDWTISDLTLQGVAPATAISAQGTVRRLLLLNLSISGFDNGIMFSPSVLDWWNSHGYPGHTLHDQIALIDSEIYSISGGSGYALYLAAKNSAVQGNYLTDTHNGQHVVRIPLMQSSVISDNRIEDAAASKHELKLHGPNWNGAGIGYQKYTERVVISQNIFSGHFNDWSVTIGPENSTTDERVRDILVDRNYFHTQGVQQVPLLVWGSAITIRNNLFELGGNSSNAMILSQNGISPAPLNTVIMNNTLARLTPSSQVSLVQIGSTVSQTLLRNNIVSAAQSPSVYINQGAGLNLTADHNLISPISAFLDAQQGDYYLAPTAAGNDAGVASVFVVDDFAGSSRQHSGAPDVGAFEN